VSALAVYLEREGITTVTVGLIRLHMEKIKPPRGLWVPFELGRPLGPPSADTDFNKAVLRRALQLTERDDGPVILDDYDIDDPTTAGDPSWQAPDLSGAV